MSETPTTTIAAALDVRDAYLTRQHEAKAPSPSLKPDALETHLIKRNKTAKSWSTHQRPDKRQKYAKRAAVPGVTAHPPEANRQAADRLKLLFEEAPRDSDDADDVVEDQTGSLEEEACMVKEEDRELPSAEWMAQRMIKNAFEREYSGQFGYKLNEGGMRDQTELWETLKNHILHHSDVSVSHLDERGSRCARHPHIAELTASTATTQTHFSDRFDARTHTALKLPGLGNGTTRNGQGHSLHGGQAVGQGVIGSHSSALSPSLSITQTAIGCDIPMRQLHPITLDARLPPLAVEHPARVWNSAIHSMPTDRQPIVKWDYERKKDDHGDDAVLAHMTLIIPPSHPAVEGHELFPTLAKNRYSREYILGAHALGAVKRWTGEPTLLKADAQNTALVACLKDGGMQWILHPSLRPVTTPASDNDDNDDHDDDHNDHVSHGDEKIHDHSERRNK